MDMCGMWLESYARSSNWCRWGCCTHVGRGAEVCWTPHSKDSLSVKYTGAAHCALWLKLFSCLLSLCSTVDRAIIPLRCFSDF